MYQATYTFYFKMIFGKKRCPICGKKMKLFYKRTPFSEAERMEREFREEMTGTPVVLNGSVRGYNAKMHLKCQKCGCVLNHDMYCAVRKMQKEIKSNVLPKEDYETIVKGKIKK